MMKFLLVACFFAITRSAPFNSELDGLWENFKNTYGKQYSAKEEGARRLIWEQNIDKIVKHNLEYDLGKHTYFLGINKYSDLSHHEFVSTLNGYKRTNRTRKPLFTFLPPSNVEFPDTVDWRQKGMVTPVKSQGHTCGSCWAFSATGSVEGQHKKKTGKLISLSEQNLIDCSIPEGNAGCSGGLMDQAFEYIRKNKGIDTEESYPYEAMNDTCRFKKNSIGATINGYADIAAGDELDLLKATATIGPISVAIDANHTDFQFYSGGIFNSQECSSRKLNHGILVIGYGSDDGQDYWLVKNSWGESWGINGYGKMSRNKNNQCGIATLASYPVV